jgi:hypothetical protein
MHELTLITPKDLEQSFDVTAAFVAEMKKKAGTLSIAGVDDREGYATVNDARKLIKEKRVTVERKRNELNADALAYQRTVNTEAKRITSMLLPIEQELEAKTKAIDAEKERLKMEAIRLKHEKTAGRIGQMVAMEMTQIGGMYYVGGQRVSHNEVDSWDDEIWSDFVAICEKEHLEIKRIEAEAKAAADAEAKRLADEKEAERVRLETEAERLKKVAKEQEANARELTRIAKEQAAEAERLKAIADTQEAERAKAEVEKAKPIEVASVSGHDIIEAEWPNMAEDTLHIEYRPLILTPSYMDITKPLTNKEFEKLALGDWKNSDSENRNKAIFWLRKHRILSSDATELIITFGDNREVDLVQLMTSFLEFHQTGE